MFSLSHQKRSCSVFPVCRVNSFRQSYFFVQIKSILARLKQKVTFVIIVLFPRARAL